MSVILNQSESEDQQGQPATEVTTVIDGDLTIPTGTHLAMQGIGALTAPPDNGLQRLLALGEIEGRLKPQIALGDLSQGVAAMIALGDMAATSPTVLKAARLQHERATAATEAVRRMLEPTAIASVEAALRMVGPTVQSLAEQQRQLAAALAFVQPGLLAGGDAWIEQGLLAPEPARRHVLPAPAQPVIVEVVQVASTDWREALAAALQEGKASPQEVIAWLRGMSRPGQKPPDWAEIEAVAALYKQHGHRYSGYETFVGYLARKGIAISVGTLKRWLALYETATGERLRPGKRGRRKLL